MGDGLMSIINSLKQAYKGPANAAMGTADHVGDTLGAESPGLWAIDMVTPWWLSPAVAGEGSDTPLQQKRKTNPYPYVPQQYAARSFNPQPGLANVNANQVRVPPPVPGVTTNAIHPPLGLRQAQESQGSQQPTPAPQRYTGRPRYNPYARD